MCAHMMCNSVGLYGSIEGHRRAIAEMKTLSVVAWTTHNQTFQSAPRICIYTQGVPTQKLARYPVGGVMDNIIEKR